MNSWDCAAACGRLCWTCGVKIRTISLRSVFLLVVPNRAPTPGRFPRIGIRSVETVDVVVMLPPSANGSPSANTTEVWKEDLLITGATIPEVVFGTAELTSWLRTSETTPLALMWGVTVRITPVSSYWMVCANKIQPPDGTGVSAEPMGIGTDAPTCIRALVLSVTKMEGADNILTRDF